MDLYDLITLSVKQNASDLHLSAGNLAMLRIDGKLQVCGDRPFIAERLEKQLLLTLDSQQLQQFEAQGELDYALTITSSGVRLRGNIFRQRQGLSAVYRRIPLQIADISSLNAPELLNQVSHLTDGLILITGATGSGKSTTLAALVQFINQQQSRHIITLEDPIEFLHLSQRSLIQQREIGLHTESFYSGLRAALREDPDIILLGELRDPDSIRLALTAAETGHLVLASLHTRSAVQSVERITDAFSAGEKPFIRSLLAGSLRIVAAQQLLSKTVGGRIAAFEVLLNTPAVANLIREGKTHQLPSVLQTGGQMGMQTMAQAVQNLIQQGVIDEKVYSGCDSMHENKHCAIF